MKNDPEEFIITVPCSVTILLFLVLSLTAWSGIRAWETIGSWQMLSRFSANPFYIFATGIIWFILGIALIFLIFKGNRHTLVITLALSLLYTLWYWLDRLAIQALPAPNVPFSLMITIITLVIFNSILFWPSSQAFFKEPQ